MRFLPIAALVCSLALVAGCGGEAVTAVEGQVTYEDQPLTHGVITFYRPEAKPISGSIMPDGNYEVGLPPGEYAVTVKSPPTALTGLKEGEAGSVPPQAGIPTFYGRRTSSGLSAQVPEGEATTQIDFDLKSQ